MFREIIDMIHDKKLKIIIYEDQIDIVNYDDILVLEDNQVLIKTKTKTIKIKGESLIITRLENNEILIKGKIKSIDMGD